MEFRTIFFGLDQGSPELRSSNVKGKNPFADVRVRQAVYPATTSRRSAAGSCDYAMSAGIVIQPGINGYAPEFDTRPAYKPDAAKGLLAEAGYPDGFTVGLDCPKNRYLNDEAICKAVEGMLAKVGIAVELAIAPMGEHVAKVRERRTDFDMLGWGRRRSIPTTISPTSTGATASTTRPATLASTSRSMRSAPSCMTYARDAAIEQV